MAQYAVMHTTKMGSGSGGIGSHIDRTQKKLPKNIDPSRVHLNKEYVATGGTLLQDVNRRIENGYNHRKKDGSLRAIRKDAVKAVGIILSGSHVRMKELEDEGRLDEWAHRNLEFMQDKIGKENIVRFTMHMDEKTPHIHCVFVPLDKEGRLCAKDIVGDKKKLSDLQTDYAQAVSKFGLERGIKHSKMKHTTTREYYRDIEKETEKVEIQTNLMGQPRKGEEERLQEIYKVMAADVYESRRLLQKERNLKPQWEDKIEAEYNSLEELTAEVNAKLQEAERLEDQQKRIISHNISKNLAVEKAKLDANYKREEEQLKQRYKDKESMLDEMLKAKYIERTLDLANRYMQEELGSKKEIKYNEKTDKFLLGNVHKKKDRGLGMGR